jgi:hypothetical protein
MNFFIKQHSTLPILKYPLPEKLLKKHNINNNMFKNVAITFSMVNQDTGTYVIANTSADLEINDDRIKRDGGEQYVLIYKFKEHQTKTVGNYFGEFVVDFLGETGCGKIKFPITETLNIFVLGSITKTTVI